MACILVSRSSPFQRLSFALSHDVVAKVDSASVAIFNNFKIGKAANGRDYLKLGFKSSRISVIEAGTSLDWDELCATVLADDRVCWLVYHFKFTDAYYAALFRCTHCTHGANAHSFSRDIIALVRLVARRFYCGGYHPKHVTRTRCSMSAPYYMHTHRSFF